MERALRCIYNLPICGGFCAPTVSPEESCLRHFSNEYTVPASGIYMKIGPVCEWSACCRYIGACGLPCGKKRRRELMLVAWAVSFFSWILLLYPVFGVSTSESFIIFAPWAKGTSYHNETQAPVEVFIGLKGRVDRFDCNKAVSPTNCTTAMRGFGSTLKYPFKQHADRGVFSRVVIWKAGDSCPSVDAPTSGDLLGSLGTVPGTAAVRGEVRRSMCEGCRKSAGETVSFAIMGAITQIPQMTTDLQRSTRFGDVNCQAVMGFLTSLWGCFSALMSLRSFSCNCWRSFPSEFPGSPLVFHWHGTLAFWGLLVASILKLWDAFTHLIVPTPTARHSKPKKNVTKLEDYMMAAVTAEEASSSDEDDELGSASESDP